MKYNTVSWYERNMTTHMHTVSLLQEDHTKCYNAHTHTHTHTHTH